MVKSNVIKINPRPVTIKNIKIKDKPYDGTNKAEFNGTPTFSDENIGKNIPINFTEFSLEGTGAENYDIIQPTNIYGNIISESSYKEDEESNIIPNSNDIELSDTSNFNDTKDNNSNNEPTNTDYNSNNNLNNIEHNSSNNFPLDINSAFNHSENTNLDNSEDSTQYDSDETATNDDQDEIFEAEDDLTGMQVYAPKGVFPKWSRLVVREMYPNTNEYSDTYKNLDEKIKNKIENIKLYEIYVVNQDGEVIQPNISKGLITVRIPIPNDYDLADLQIYRIKQDADDDFDETIVNINNRNYCEFQTNHFSPYTMIDENSINDIIQSLIPYMLLLLILTLISLFIIIITKRKKAEDKDKE